MNQLNDDSIADIATIKKGIDYIESLVLNDKSFEEIKSLIISTLGGMPSTGLSFLLNTPIYRARILNENENKSNPSTFSYPPANYAKRLRANLDGHSVFYGSAGVATTFHELGCKFDDTVYIGKWFAPKDTTVRGAVFVYDNSKGIGELWNRTNDANIEKLENVIKHLRSDKKEAFMYLSFRLGDWFLKKEHFLSSTLAHFALYDIPRYINFQYDLITFPSQAANNLGVNYAIHPHFVPKMALKKVIRCKLKAPLEEIVTGEKSILSEADLAGDNINGTIIWRKPTIEDVEEFK
jgi:hypothetical protein